MRVGPNGFHCAFKSGFFQFTFQASLIFKPNLELAVTIIFKKKRLCKSKHAMLEFKWLKS